MTDSAEKYHFRQIRVGEMPEPTPETEIRRELAAELKAITEQLIRLDADTATLADYRDQLSALSGQLAAHNKRDHGVILSRLFQGEASRQDLLDVLDFEILTGKSTPLSPPVELWTEGQVVHGRANFGLPWQGPPGRVHGGVIALTMDILMAKTQDFFSNMGMTGTLSLRYHAATPLQGDVQLKAEVVRIEGRKLFNKGYVMVGDKVSVEADGIWISVNGDYRWRQGYGPEAIQEG